MCPADKRFLHKVNKFIPNFAKCDPCLEKTHKQNCLTSNSKQPAYKLYYCYKVDFPVVQLQRLRGVHKRLGVCFHYAPMQEQPSCAAGRLPLCFRYQCPHHEAIANPIPTSAAPRIFQNTPQYTLPFIKVWSLCRMAMKIKPRESKYTSWVS